LPTLRREIHNVTKQIFQFSIHLKYDGVIFLFRKLHIAMTLGLYYIFDFYFPVCSRQQKLSLCGPFWSKKTNIFRQKRSNKASSKMFVCLWEIKRATGWRVCIFTETAFYAFYKRQENEIFTPKRKFWNLQFNKMCIM
jgi:hypothetical protein